MGSFFQLSVLTKYHLGKVNKLCILVCYHTFFFFISILYIYLKEKYKFTESKHT